MHYFEVAPIKIVRKNADRFTYHNDVPLEVGAVVAIPVGTKTITGVVMACVEQPSFMTKAIAAVIEQTPLPQALVTTIEWIAHYYHTPLATVLSAALPTGLTKKRRERATQRRVSVRQQQEHTPTDYQTAAIKQILSKQHTTALLHGVTGSGKTLVYRESIAALLDEGKSSIVLVPEIALTSQLIDELQSHFGDNVVVAHSRQTEAERHLVWRRCLETTEPLVVVGARSALFLPLRSVGGIFVDECHEPSFKQDQAPRYSALRVATILAKQHDGVAVFGSATPPVAEYYVAQQADAIITLPTPAVTGAVKPSVTVIDMKQRSHFARHQHRFLSDKLIQAITESVAQGKQSLVFHNRRGTTATTLCSNCGWTALDPDTELPLTLHADTHTLVSHVTGYTAPVPTACPVCRSVDIIHKGIGTKLIETELRRLFPKQSIVRFDGDIAQDATIEQRYKELYDGSIDIIIGTQVVAKGFDLPQLQTVGVVQADAGLSLPDFQSDERVFQLLSQVIGRVGRRAEASEVVIQAFQPTHPAITDGAKQDYASFYQHALPKRKKHSFPPFAYLAQFTCSYKTEAAAVRNARALLTLFRSAADPSVTFLGPTPAFYEKQHGTFRWQITAKCHTRTHLASLIEHLPPTHWHYELDPATLL